MEDKRNAAPAPIGRGLFALVINAVNIGTVLSSDSLIINFGAKGFKALQVLTMGASIFAGVVFLIALVKFLIRLSKEKAAAVTEAPEETGGMLSASGKLWDEYVLKQLVDHGLKKWKCIEKDISELTDQLILMNSYQERLSALLANNSAQALSDTEDILDRIEQQILGNVRKVLNFMEILGTDDKQTVSEYVKVCVQDNKKLLDATKDFLLCITSFLNGQGTRGENDLQMIEDFKTVLMGNINEEELKI